MKKTIIIFLIACTVHASAQTTGHWGLSIQVQPENAFYSSNYAFRWNPKNTKTAFNTGAAAVVQYNLPAGFFAYAGLGYISRAFHSTVFLNQGALPPPQWSGTYELVTAPDVYYHILYAPAGVGYAFINKTRFKCFAAAEFCGNYLLNATYHASEQKYDGTFPQNTWQGYSLSPVLGLEEAVIKNTFFTFSLSYSLVNHVDGDKYLSGQDARQLAITYNYLKFSLGVKFAF